MRQHFANPALVLTPHILFVRTKILHEWLFHAIGCALAQSQNQLNRIRGRFAAIVFGLCNPKMI
ncbi:hypothetical protein D1K97_24780 [Salmonella enterica]|nr:hypothetical protein [Salmonella enterica]